MDIFIPSHPLVAKYVECIYILDKKSEPLKYVSYPSPFTAIGLFSNAKVTCSEKILEIDHAVKDKYFGIACNRLHNTLVISYLRIVNEISIVFKPLGYNSFCGGGYDHKDMFIFTSWDADLKLLLDGVFNCDAPSKRFQIIESFLLERYTPISEEKLLAEAIRLLCDFTKNYSLDEIAAVTGVHYKYLYRCFKKYIGCSPAHFRTIEKFRTSVYAALKEKKSVSLTNICYENNYSDQSYFIRQFRQIAGERPTALFKDVALYSNHKLVWKFL